MTFRIGPHEIGTGRCFVVAEAGVNHNGNAGTALLLIRAAKAAGADAVKFQRRTPRAILTEDAYDRSYEGPNSYGITYGAHREALELSDTAWRSVMETAARLEIPCFASAWDEASADALIKLGVPALKVASADLTNTPLIDHMARMGVPLIVSTGMSTLAEVDDAYAVICATGCDQFALLHCVSTYPAEPEMVNLRVMETLRQRYPGVPIGYSGHETGLAVSVAAAALGAAIIERHLTLNRAAKGPDHAASLEPDGLRRLVRDIRNVEAALGDGRKRLLDSERPVRARLAKSLVVAHDRPVGHVLDATDFIAKSPGFSIAPRYRSILIGLPLVRDVIAGRPLQWADVAWSGFTRSEE